MKGYYLVAKSMADTYTEVSAGYIIPGVNQIERLSLPEAKNLTREERAAKISEVGHLAQTAKDEVKRIANQVHFLSHYTWSLKKDTNHSQ